MREDQSVLANWTRGDRQARFEQTAARHAGLSQFAAPFLSRMTFVDEHAEGVSPTLSAVRLYRAHRAAARRGVPLDFAPMALQPLINHNGETDRRRWESALFLWSSGHTRPPATARSSSTAIRGRVKSLRGRSRRATAICHGPTLRPCARRRGICIWAGTCGHPCTAARRRDRGHSRHSAASRSTTRSRSARTVAMWASWPTTRSTATTTPSIRARTPTTWLGWLELSRPTGDGHRNLRTSPRLRGATVPCSRRSANWPHRGSDEGLLTWARTLNSEFAVPLPESEVRGISRRGYSGRRREGGALAWCVGLARSPSGNRGPTWASADAPGIGVSVGRKRTAKAGG